MDKKLSMTIGTISRLSGLSAKTIRYYEEIGLVAAPSRTDAGYRQYSDADLHVLAFVRRARELGFSLNETAELLALWKDRSRSSAEIKSLATQRLSVMDRKLAELESLRVALSDLVSRCSGDDWPDCPIIGHMSGRAH
tara:strand:- start:418 stop:831 length:414 start_codon:yes stop_codon:yes gene_type:complete